MKNMRCIMTAVIIMGFPFLAQAEDDQPPMPEQEKNQPEWLIKAANTFPHERQQKWMELELTCFIHFGPNTFTGVEWGTGNENPDVFNPTALDCEQWVKVAKAAGMKMIMLTCKHHDGFCLWPSRYTEHSPKNSSWKDGKGDVLRELVDACKKHDMRVGVYLSPADLYQMRDKGLYGNHSTKTTCTIPDKGDGRPYKNGHPTFTYDNIDDYNAYMLNQLYEVLYEYGPIHEVWFDGAHPKNKGGQKYNRSAWYDLIRNLAPEAVIAIKGPDVRWCGNEAGRGRANEYSVVPIKPKDETWNDRHGNLGSRGVLKNAYDKGYKFHWYPSEVDTSIRRGWFYNISDDVHPKGSLKRLLECYYDATGNNSVFLLNVPPNKSGLIDDSDAATLVAFGKVIKSTFSVNLAKDAKVYVSASLKGHGPEALLDDNPETYWQLPKGQNRGWIQLNLNGNKTFDVIDIQECTFKAGQRIEAFSVEAWTGDKWVLVKKSGTVGYRKALRIPQTTASKVRIHITSARSNPSIRSIGLYKQLLILEAPVVKRDRNGMLEIIHRKEMQVYYTLDGSDPRGQTAIKYNDPFLFDRKGIVKAVVIDPKKPKNKSTVSSMIFDITKKKWSIESVSSEHDDLDNKAVNAIDDNSSTYWRTQKHKGQPRHPHSIVINFGETLSLAGFSYTPPVDVRHIGCAVSYKLELSMDGGKWTTASESKFDNMINNPSYREVKFDKVHKATFMKLTLKDEIKGRPGSSAVEIGVITE